MRKREIKALVLLLAAGLLPLLVGKPAIADNHRPPLNLSMQFVQIPQGCFQMGAIQIAALAHDGLPMGSRADELPQHHVCIDSFWLGTHEVTQQQWHEVMGDAPVTAMTARQPKAYITWEDTQRFINRLNQASTAMQYRLPTEAEWEYACLADAAGKDIHLYSSEYADPLKKVAWFKKPKRSDPQPRPVGEMTPNAWGLYDMLGNMWEWTADEYQADAYRSHPKANPLLDRGGEKRVIRGASYTSELSLVRCRSRNYGIPNDPLPTQGLRLVRQPVEN